jgi:DNA-binding response OmpR family regulator
MAGVTFSKINPRKLYLAVQQTNPGMLASLEQIFKDSEFNVYGCLTKSDIIGALNRGEYFHLVVIDKEEVDLDMRSFISVSRSIQPKIRIILVTEGDTPRDYKRYFDLGIDDIVEKPISDLLLLGRVEARLSRYTEDLTKLVYGELELDEDMKMFSIKENEVMLTPREFALMKFFILNQGKVVSRDQLLDEVWRDKEYLNPRVVDVYVGYLRDKLAKHYERNPLQTRRGFGYMLSFS